MRTRDRIKTAALKSKSRILMDAYRQARNRIKSLNIQLKRQYFSAKISECKGNMKESWKTVNWLLSKRSKFCNIDCLKGSEHIFVNKKAISNAMKNFFCAIHLFSISRNASEKGPGETYQVKRFSHSNLKLQNASKSV